MGPGIAWLMILAGLLVVQFLFWVAYCVRGNAAIVDVGWTLGIGLAALFLVLAGPRPARASGLYPRGHDPPLEPETESASCAPCFQGAGRSPVLRPAPPLGPVCAFGIFSDFRAGGLDW